jgi:hypothetical protein
MGLTIMKLKTLIQQKQPTLQPQPQKEKEEKEEPPTKKRKQTRKKPHKINRWCYFKQNCWQRENCRYKHSEEELRFFQSNKSTNNTRIQIFVENLGTKDRLIDVNPNHCIADSLADRFRMKKGTL